jgi:hypothetical protein
MLNDWYKGLPRKIKKIILSVAILIFGAFAAYLIWSFTGVYVSDSFVNSRQLASEYAHIIADSVQDTPKNLETIQTLERQGKDEKALTLLVTESQKNATAQDAAVKLSSELGKMAMEISNIRPKKAGQVALVAITHETNLIYELVSYNNNLANLLGLLRDRLTGKLYGVEKINKVVDMLNTEIDSINKLNSQFIESMAEFDRSV